MIDISKKENGQIADKYEVTWSSLFVNGWKDGKENVNNMTEFSFSNARKSPDKFKEGIKNKVCLLYTSPSPRDRKARLMNC